MKSLKNSIVLLVFLISLLATKSIIAQAKIPLAPENMVATIEHLDFRYGNIITTELISVKTKLSSEFAGAYDPELTAPQPNIRYITNNNISFFWPEDLNVHHVNVFYFNLNSGSTMSIDSVLVDSISINLPERAPYLFAFQSIGYSEEKGQMTLMLADHSFDFIIVDKDILRSDIPFEYMTCGCSSGNIAQHDVDRGLFNTIFIPWTAPCISSKYNLDIQLTTASFESHFVSLDFVHDQESYSYPLAHSLNYCSHPDFSTPYNLGIPDLCETIITSKGVTLYFDKEDVASVNFTPTVCDCSNHKGDGNKGIGSTPQTKQQLITAIDLQVYPNPVAQQTTIDYRLPEAGPVSIVLYNTFSQEVRYLKQNEFHDKGDYRHAFNTDDLAAGVYNCVLSFNGKNKTTRLVKLKL